MESKQNVLKIRNFYTCFKNFREKRKSTGQLHFYPLEDDEDLTWAAKPPSRQSTAITETISRIESPKTESEPKRAPMLSTKYRSVSLFIVMWSKYNIWC